VLSEISVIFVNMNWLVTILLSGLMHTLATAHAFYFSFAELEYNIGSSQYELTISATAHDVALMTQQKGMTVSELDKETKNGAFKSFLTTEINAHFQIAELGENAFQLLGFEVFPNGTAYFYLYSKKVEVQPTLSITFDWLMDTFPEQQNKITFRNGEQKHTAVFLPQNPKTIIATKP